MTARRFRIANITSAHISDDRAMALFRGNTFTGEEGEIEIEVKALPHLVGALLSVALEAERKQNLPASPPGDGTRLVMNLPATDLHVVSSDDSSVTLVQRVGLLDLQSKLTAPVAIALSGQLVRMTR